MLHLQVSCADQEQAIAQAKDASELLLLDVVAQTRALGEQEKEVGCCSCLPLHRATLDTSHDQHSAAARAVHASGHLAHQCGSEACQPLQVAAQETACERQAAQQQTLAAAVEATLGAAEPQLAAAQLGLQRVTSASLAQLVRQLLCVAALSCRPGPSAICISHAPRGGLLPCEHGPGNARSMREPTFAEQDCYKPHPLVDATLMGLCVLLKLPPTLLEAKVRPAVLPLCRPALPLQLGSYGVFCPERLLSSCIPRSQPRSWQRRSQPPGHG